MTHVNLKKLIEIKMEFGVLLLTKTNGLTIF